MDEIQTSREFAQHVQELKKKQFFEDLFFMSGEQEVPANGDADIEIDIKNDFHFRSGFLTVSYTTLIDDPANPGSPLDDGINHLSVQFFDASNDFRMQSGPISLELVATPGRQLAPGVSASFAPNSLFFPFKFKHIYGANGSIIARFHNNSDWPNTVKMLWTGENLINQEMQLEDFE